MGCDLMGAHTVLRAVLEGAESHLPPHVARFWQWWRCFGPAAGVGSVTEAGISVSMLGKALYLAPRGTRMDGLRQGWEGVCSSYSDLGEESTGEGQSIFTRTETRPWCTSLLGAFHHTLRLLALFAGMFVGREEICEIQLPCASVSKWCVGSLAAGKWSEGLSHEAESHGVCSQESGSVWVSVRGAGKAYKS